MHHGKKKLSTNIQTAILVNNTSLPQLRETPEVFDILYKFSMLKNFGGAFTLSNLDNEPFLEIQYMQLCLSASIKYQEMEARKIQNGH